MSETLHHTPQQILVVDDDQEILDLLTQHLSLKGFGVYGAGNGMEMFQQLAQHTIDLVILDVMLPGDDGFTLCQRLRHQSNIPVIMLTASADETDRVLGLEIGADDYIAKPFSPRELMARVKALLRRAQMPAKANDELKTLLFAHWQFDPLRRQLIAKEGNTIQLSTAEFNLLQLFLNHPNQIVDRDQISNTLHGRDALPYDRSIDVQVSRLRQRLGDKGNKPQIIQTVRGSGYILTANVTHGS